MNHSISNLDTLAANLLSPIILAFALGVVASLVRSDLRLPEALYNGLSIYLLLAIGLKGVVELNRTPIGEFIGPALLTLVLGILTPIIAYNVLRRLGKFDRVDSAAIAAHYGSVSGSAVLGAMVSSASYIAAPAAVRIALPEAHPTYYVTASPGITFPFNVTLGIPLYYAFATRVTG